MRVKPMDQQVEEHMGINIPPQSSVGAEVVHGPIIRLWKDGISIQAPPEALGPLQAEGWRTYEPDLKKLAREVDVWLKAMGGAVDQFVADVQKSETLDTDYDAALATMQRAARQVNEVVQNLTEAAFSKYPVKEGT